MQTITFVLSFWILAYETPREAGYHQMLVHSELQKAQSWSRYQCIGTQKKVNSQYEEIINWLQAAKLKR